MRNLLDDPRIWRGARTSSRAWPAGLPTGYDALDAYLPGGGWPVGALTEIIPENDGVGELQLLMPALAALSRQGRGHRSKHRSEAADRQWIVWVAPPYQPYPPALAAAGLDLERTVLVCRRGRTEAPADVLWAVEQALRSGVCAAVLTWLPDVDDRDLRRLQLAAEEGAAWGVIFRPLRALKQASPAALRLRVRPSEAGVELQLVKCRGGRPGVVRISVER